MNRNNQNVDWEDSALFSDSSDDGNPVTGSTDPLLGQVVVKGPFSVTPSLLGSTSSSTSLGFGVGTLGADPQPSTSYCSFLKPLGYDMDISGTGTDADMSSFGYRFEITEGEAPQIDHQNQSQALNTPPRGDPEAEDIVTIAPPAEPRHNVWDVEQGDVGRVVEWDDASAGYINALKRMDSYMAPPPPTDQTSPGNEEGDPIPPNSNQVDLDSIMPSIPSASGSSTATSGDDGGHNDNPRGKAAPAANGKAPSSRKPRKKDTGGFLYQSTDDTKRSRQAKNAKKNRDLKGQKMNDLKVQVEELTRKLDSESCYSSTLVGFIRSVGLEPPTRDDQVNQPLADEVSVTIHGKRFRLTPAEDDDDNDEDNHEDEDN